MVRAGSQYDASYAEIEYFSVSACINALMQMCINSHFASYCEPALSLNGWGKLQSNADTVDPH